MQFELSEDNVLLKDSTQEFLTKESSLEKVRSVIEEVPEGFSRAVYAQLAQLGYWGLTLPESQAGSGIGAVGLAVVTHEMGRVAFPGPFLDILLGAEILSRLTSDVTTNLLKEVVEGKKIVLLARTETLMHPQEPAMETSFSGGKVSGIKGPIAFGASADALLVATKQGLILVSRPEAGWNLVPLDTFDHAQRFVRITLDDPGELVSDLSVLEEVNLLGTLGASGFLLGLMERSLELSVDYLKERQAFDQTIGSFQALQHRAADMWIQTESSRSAVYRAAWALEAQSDEASLLVAAAKAYSGDAAGFVCGATIQMFGGVGFTWEYDPHIYFKRAKTLQQLYGSTRNQLEFALQARGI
ncbi:MAG: acyl-CoA dehydrogenase family protein [Acidobacteriota bacterium]|nr:acyl-CoA dehydrogenase family protein [Acidobacteriota bacterium]